MKELLTLEQNVLKMIHFMLKRSPEVDFYPTLAHLVNENLQDE